MKIAHSILVSIAVLFFATSVRAELLPKPAKRMPEKVDCAAASTQLELNQCAGERFKNADDEMNRLYKEKIAALKADREAFRDAQRAWITFRDKACLYETGPQEGSGSIWPLEHLNCMEYHTKKRIEDLKNYLACTSDDCPN